MKVLVCGSRSCSNAETIRHKLAELPEGTHVIHGGSGGADRIAATIAEVFGLHVTEFPADWDRYGKRAGLVRNIEMLDENPDLVIAFWDGNSRGTAHTITEALKRGIPVEVIEL